MATNTWKVDMIVMSFGFEAPIPIIRQAIEAASTSEKKPLFFAATRNDGANRGVAWPARHGDVIGVSSTDGLGTGSTFNPTDDGLYSVVYALGEGIEVRVPHPKDPRQMAVKLVSATSYANPVAAGLAATMLGFLRLSIKRPPKERPTNYETVLAEVQSKDGMKAVLRNRMTRLHNSGLRSLLPWDFLTEERLRSHRIILDVCDTLSTGS